MYHTLCYYDGIDVEYFASLSRS